MFRSAVRVIMRLTIVHASRQCSVETHYAFAEAMKEVRP